MNLQPVDADIVIVGSGAGGGTVASVLAPLCKKGLRVLLLEAGARYEPIHHTRQELEMAQQFLFGGGAIQNKSQDINYAFGHALGGGTTVYTGVSFTASAAVLQGWQIDGINASDLAPHYQKYLQQNHVHYLSDKEINENNRLFKYGGIKVGFDIQQFPVNTKNCLGLGTCNLGCANSAKQGTAQVQIPAAEQLGVEVVHLCEVLLLEDGALIVEVKPPARADLAPSPWQIGHYRINAKTIVLCAGSPRSPALLLKSFAHRGIYSRFMQGQKKTRQKLSGDTGHYFICHPAVIAAAEHDHDIESMAGFPKTYYCDQFVDSDGFLLESCMYYPFILSKNLSGYGQDLEDLLKHYPRLQMALMLVMDKARRDNRISINRRGEFQIHYQLDAAIIEAFIKASKATARLFFAAGAKRIHVPGMASFFLYSEQAQDIDQLIHQRHFITGKTAISSAHLLGGCRMGNDSNSGVTDSRGKVFGLENIYVADGSLMPQSPEVNPYLTIMALADRVAEGILQQY